MAEELAVKAVYPPNEMSLMENYVKAFQKVFGNPEAWLEN